MGKFFNSNNKTTSAFSEADFKTLAKSVKETELVEVLEAIRQEHKFLLELAKTQGGIKMMGKMWGEVIARGKAGGYEWPGAKKNLTSATFIEKVAKGEWPVLTMDESEEEVEENGEPSGAGAGPSGSPEMLAILAKLESMQTVLNEHSAALKAVKSTKKADMLETMKAFCDSGAVRQQQDGGPVEVGGSDSDEDVVIKVPRRNNKKKRKQARIVYSSSSSDDEGNYKQRRKSAENADIQVPLSGLPMSLLVPEKERLGAITCLAWIRQHGTVTTFIQQSPDFNNSTKGGGTVRNRKDAEALARVLDLAINEQGWKAVCRLKWFEVAVRRIFALETACKNGNWEVASNLEEHRSGLGPDGLLAISRANKQYKLEKQLAALQQGKKSAAAGAKPE